MIRRARGVGLLLFAMVLARGLVLAQSTEADSDHDGLSDVREQALLERFVPRFQVSMTDCAGKPALFAEGVAKPTVMERDGTIYGQVTPRNSGKDGDAVVEVHFYDLWSVECGLWANGTSAGCGACICALAGKDDGQSNRGLAGIVLVCGGA